MVSDQGLQCLIIAISKKNRMKTTKMDSSNIQQWKSPPVYNGSNVTGQLLLMKSWEGALFRVVKSSKLVFARVVR